MGFYFLNDERVKNGVHEWIRTEPKQFFCDDEMEALLTDESRDRRQMINFYVWS